MDGVKTVDEMKGMDKNTRG